MLYMQHFMSKISAKNVFIIIKTCSASGGRPLNYLPQLFNFPLDPRGLEETLLFTKAKPMPLTKNSVDATVERHRKFSSTIYSFLFCAWNITTVEINSGIHLLQS